MNPGHIIKLLRTANGEKQLVLASQLGVSVSYLSQLESGKKTPSLDLIQRVASIFQVPPAMFLVDGENVSGELERKLHDLLGNLLATKSYLRSKDM